MQKRVLPPTWLQFFIITLLVLGVFFRFVNLDRKVYWIDETYTSLRISGHTETEVIQQVFDGHVVNIKELQKYQQPNPEKGLISTINSLAVESPQHPPLYYVMARFWLQLWGTCRAVLRSLSALLSLVKPCKNLAGMSGQDAPIAVLPEGPMTIPHLELAINVAR